MISAKLKECKEFLAKNEDKIILAVGFALVAILSYGAGKLSVVYQPQAPIVFTDSANCEKVLADGVSAENALSAEKNEGKIIGNKNSLIYHIPGGVFYDKVNPENRVYFSTEADAQKAGYRKSKN